MQLSTFSTLAREEKNARPMKVEGLCGRIIRGTKPSDFETLTDDPHRQLVLLMGPDGLELMLGRDDYERLLVIGYEDHYIETKVKAGNQFKLIVFPEGGPAKLATWENVAQVVAEVYPETQAAFTANLEVLKQTCVADFEAQAGYSFFEVDKLGSGDSRYMTYQRFCASAKTAMDLRSFLFFTVHLRSLFSGDGYTYDQNGKRGLMEYIVPNQPIAKLGDHQLIEMNIKLPVTTGVKTVAKQQALPIPQFYDASKADKVWRVPYQERAVQAQAYAKQNNVKPAAKDKMKVCLMIIDAQNTFCQPDFELYVGGRSGRGAVEDNQRLAEFVYRNLGAITQIAPTMDTHTLMQIFHPIFWVDAQGANPAPMTMISLAEVEKGVWRVNPGVAQIAGGKYLGLQKHALHYTKRLTQGGKYPLMIWPYHAMLGGVGHALASIIEEAVFFHAVVRQSQTNFQIKGGNPLTENYSVLRPEVLDGDGGQMIGQKNAQFIKMLMSFDRVVIAGQAKSHCVAWTIDDLLTEINAQDPELAKKVVLLEDCTSPVVVPGVVDFTDQADAAFARFASAGMKVVKSTDSVDGWL